MNTEMISILISLSILLGNALAGLYLRTVRKEVREIRLWQKKKDRSAVKIYVVDDDADDLETIQTDVLVKFDNPYFLCVNEKELFDKVSSGRNVVILDHFLGSTSGIEILKKIKELNQQNFVISCAGTKNDQVFTDYVKHGIDRFVYKENPDFLLILETAIFDGINEVAENNIN